MRWDVADLGQLGIKLRNHVAHDAGHGGIVKHVEELERVRHAVEQPPLRRLAAGMRARLAQRLVVPVDKPVAPAADAAVREGIEYSGLVHPLAMLGETRCVIWDTTLQDTLESSTPHDGETRPHGDGT